MRFVPRFRLFPSAQTSAHLAAVAAIVAHTFVIAQAQTPASLPLPYADDEGEFRDVGFDTAPAFLASVDGDASIERDGVRVAADESAPLVPGDRLQTRFGRVEITLADSSSVYIDNDTDLDWLADDLVRLRSGRLLIVRARTEAPSTFRVDAAGTSAEVRASGEYRLTLVDLGGDPELVMAVRRGTGALISPFGRTLVRAGFEAHTRATSEPSLPRATNTSAFDSLDAWVDMTRDGWDRTPSAEYLPTNIRQYSAELDRHGAWGYEAAYGPVWYPNVASGWRPYYDGRWSFTASFGWVWIGSPRWSWPTHHYGRWGLSAGRWFWIPDRRWSPAWVSWASAPGYVSWCPLGRDNRPVVAVASISANRSTWQGWTIVPRRSFTATVVVRRQAIDAWHPSSGIQFVGRRNASPRTTWSASRAGSQSPTRVMHVSRPEDSRGSDDRPTPRVIAPPGSRQADWRNPQADDRITSSEWRRAPSQPARARSERAEPAPRGPSRTTGTPASSAPATTESQPSRQATRGQWPSAGPGTERQRPAPQATPVERSSTWGRPRPSPSSPPATPSSGDQDNRGNRRQGTRSSEEGATRPAPSSSSASEGRRASPRRRD